MAVGVIPRSSRRLPLLGDVVGFNPRTPIQDLTKLSMQLGPIFERTLFGRRIVYVAGAELVGELSDESRFEKYVTNALAGLRPIVGDALFTAYNDEPNWQLAHDLLHPAFSQAAMRSYHDIMVDETSKLLRRWDRFCDGSPVDASRDMTRLTLETIGRTGFGYRFGSFENDDTHPFVRAMLDSLWHAQLRTFLSPPLIGDLLWRKADNRDRRRLVYMNSVVDDVIAKRLANGGGGADLLEKMLAASDVDGANRLGMQNIRQQIITFMLAGHETTSGALSFALYYLSKHPEVLRRAQHEVDEVWGDDLDDPPIFEKVAKLRYVRRILDESLRLWPTAPVFARAAREDTLLAGQYPMRKGEGFLIVVQALHRDQVWGEGADEFNPDRFEPAQTRKRPANAYKPFGTGERGCIGRQFAIHEALLVLGSLLRRYDFRGKSDYTLSVEERLTIRPQNFYLDLNRR